MKSYRWMQAGLVFLMWLLLLALPVKAASNGGMDVQQTGASGRQVKLSWKRPGQAVRYKFYYKFASDKAYKHLKDVNASGENCAGTFTLPKAGRNYHIKIVPYDKMNKAGAASQFKDCRTAPGKITLRSQKSYATSASMKVYWNAVESAQGYEFQVMDLYGGLVKRFKVEKKSSATLTGISAGSFYHVRIRGYSRVGKKVFYGAASDTYIAQQPRVKFKWASHCVVKAYWPAVEGAMSYTVYVSENPSRGFRKATMTFDRQAFVPGLSRNRKYYAYVVANMRKGKKTYASPKTNYYTFRLQMNED